MSEEKFNLYNHEGHLAIIKNINKKSLKNGAFSYGFQLEFAKICKTGNHLIIWANAYIPGNKPGLMSTYDSFTVGQTVNARLRRAGNFNDIYRLETSSTSLNFETATEANSQAPVEPAKQTTAATAKVTNDANSATGSVSLDQLPF